VDAPIALTLHGPLWHHPCVALRYPAFVEGLARDGYQHPRVSDPRSRWIPDRSPSEIDALLVAATRLAEGTSAVEAAGLDPADYRSTGLLLARALERLESFEAGGDLGAAPMDAYRDAASLAEPFLVLLLANLDSEALAAERKRGEAPTLGVLGQLLRAQGGSPFDPDEEKKLGTDDGWESRSPLGNALREVMRERNTHAHRAPSVTALDAARLLRATVVFCLVWVMHHEHLLRARAPERFRAVSMPPPVEAAAATTADPVRGHVHGSWLAMAVMASLLALFLALRTPVVEVTAATPPATAAAPSPAPTSSPMPATPVAPPPSAAGLRTVDRPLEGAARLGPPGVAPQAEATPEQAAEPVALPAGSLDGTEASGGTNGALPLGGTPPPAAPGTLTELDAPEGDLFVDELLGDPLDEDDDLWVMATADEAQAAEMMGLGPVCTYRVRPGGAEVRDRPLRSGVAVEQLLPNTVIRVVERRGNYLRLDAPAVGWVRVRTVERSCEAIP
jgi:hypothetical protein